MIPLEKAVSEYLAQNAKQCDYNPTCKQASPPISVFLDFNSDNSFFWWGGVETGLGMMEKRQQYASGGKGLPD